MTTTETTPTNTNHITTPPAAPARTPDTTALAARPEIAQTIRYQLRRYRVAHANMADAIASVQTEAIAVARTGTMPRNLAQWKALAATIAVRWALDRLRERKRRTRYDGGLCEDPDAYLRPTLYWEHRDPIDTKRYLAILKELFDSGQMPEHGEEILQDEADGVPHAETAAELGLGAGVVRKRLYRMRAKFHAKLAALGMLPASRRGMGARATSQETRVRPPSKEIANARGTKSRPRRLSRVRGTRSNLERVATHRERRRLLTKRDSDFDPPCAKKRKRGVVFEE
jgi:DNA-directed RNA polymerase specialized sigma24 family protein